MPIIKSAKKRVRVAEKATIRNAKTKRTLREAVKAFSHAISAGGAEEIARTEREAMSAIDRAAKKAVIHKNKAARQKARISLQAKTAAVKPAKAVKKTVAKKATTTKKAVAKKAPAKKPAAKRTSKQ